MQYRQTIKALSIRQPWAWLIVHGGKDIENRTWRTKYRGPVLIHASKKIDHEAVNRLIADGVTLPDEFETGGIIGMAEIKDCVEESKSKWFRGPFGLVLTKQAPVNFYPCKGKLYFFEPGHP